MRILWWLNLVSGSDCQQYRRKLQAPNLPTPSHIFSESRAPQVIFINRALSEVAQTKLNRLGNAQTGHIQAVAFGFGLIQNRTGLFFARAFRCPGGGACSVQNNSPFFGPTSITPCCQKGYKLFEIFLWDADDTDFLTGNP